MVYSEVRRPCRVMILVNPHSGRGQALQLFSGHVEGMLTEAAVPYTLVTTGQWRWRAHPKLRSLMHYSCHPDPKKPTHTNTSVSLLMFLKIMSQSLGLLRISSPAKFLWP